MPPHLRELGKHSLPARGVAQSSRVGSSQAHQGGLVLSLNLSSVSSNLNSSFPSPRTSNSPPHSSHAPNSHFPPLSLSLSLSLRNALPVCQGGVRQRVTNCDGDTTDIGEGKITNTHIGRPCRCVSLIKRPRKSGSFKLRSIRDSGTSWGFDDCKPAETISVSQWSEKSKMGRFLIAALLAVFAARAGSNEGAAVSAPRARTPCSHSPLRSPPSCNPFPLAGVANNTVLVHRYTIRNCKQIHPLANTHTHTLSCSHAHAHTHTLVLSDPFRPHGG
jgi:hypothetical protein